MLCDDFGSKGLVTNRSERQMNIEKVSKYITKYTDTDNPKYGTFTRRNILLSLPRVKWLERQPDYTPWPPLPPITAPEVRTDHKPINTRKFSFRPQTRNNELSPSQQQAWNLHRNGKSHAQIGEEMGKSSNAIGKLLAQAREKLGINLK